MPDLRVRRASCVARYREKKFLTDGLLAEVQAVFFVRFA